MSATKLGYVIRYQDPLNDNATDEFLKVDTTGPVLKFSTTTLNEATVFETEAAAGFLTIQVPDRTAEVREVHQIMHRRLAERGGAATSSVKDIIAKFSNMAKLEAQDHRKSGGEYRKSIFPDAIVMDRLMKDQK
jgi:hypothetical protein